MGALISSCSYTDSYVNNSIIFNSNQNDTFITVDDITYHFYTSFIFSNIIYYKKYIYLIKIYIYVLRSTCLCIKWCCQFK